jgi:pimeloyl-ACP methyl ester carboxylesterase
MLNLPFCLIITLNIIAATHFGFLRSPGDILKLTTKDHLQLEVLYKVPDVSGSKVPAVVFIHQGGSNKEEWTKRPLFNKLYRSGIAVLALDLRGHGNSGKGGKSISDLFSNPGRVPVDVMAAVKFLSSDPRIDTRRLAIIGSSIGGNLACMAISLKTYNIKTAVAISCKPSAIKNLSGGQNIHQKNIFLISSDRDQNGKRAEWASELYDLAENPKKSGIAGGTSHGVNILNDNPDLENKIFNCITRNL